MSVLHKLTEEWNEIKEIVVYGYGRVAQRNMSKLSEEFIITTIIDNNEQVQNQNYKGIPIVKLCDIKDQLNGTKIVVATGSRAYADIAEDLRGIGLIEYSDYCRLEEFIPEWYWKNRQQVCFSQVFTSLTSRCTLKCKYCSMLMPYYEKDFDVTKEEFRENLELLFKYTDYLMSFYLIGGEPFLNHDLAYILQILGEKYSSRIGYIQIITNGTVIPDNDVLEMLQRYKVKVRISDYTHVLPYETRIQEVKALFAREKIEFTVYTFREWCDLGIPMKEEPVGNTEEAYRQHMLNCSVGCHLINDRKLFYCGTLFSAEKSGRYKLKESDYLALDNMGDADYEAKKKILKYCLDGPDSGYISLCKICRGRGTDNDREISAAEQMGNS